MNRRHLVISPAAREDLGDIYHYSVHSRGISRASDYLDNLKSHLWELTEQPGMGVERGELMPDMRSLPVASHIVFYRLREAQVEIVRVLHARQDPRRHIS